MHFSKIFLQENFVPDRATDPYGRKVIGIEVTLSSDESITRAEQLAGDYIKDYIQKNIIVSHSHIEEKYIPEELLPEIQVEKVPIDLEEAKMLINDCATIAELDGWNGVVKQNPELGKIFARKAAQLLSPKK